MPTILDDMASVSVSPLNEGEMTGHEDQLIADQLVDDDEVLMEAERVAKSLAPGHLSFRCPDQTCGFRAQGPRGSQAERSYKAHIDRHGHATLALRQQRSGTGQV